MKIALNETNHMQINFVSFIYNLGFLQANDSKHKSKSTQDWIADKRILQNVMITPASSPDLNQTENV